MKNYEKYTDYELNLLCAKHELQYQPFVKSLPQRDIFGNDTDNEYEELNDQSVYILTASGREQKINFCEDVSQSYNLMVTGKINVNFYDNDEGGHCSTDTSFFVDFTYNLKRAILITYLIEKGLLPKHGE